MDRKMSEPVATDVDTIIGYEGNRDDEDSEGSLIEEDDNLFFMEPDHEEVRAREDPDTQGYWEAGLTTESLNALKTGNIDHSQRSCYHCGRKGHIKANCYERRKLGMQPWDRRQGSKTQKTKRPQHRRGEHTKVLM